jgi:hypothetical protein
VIEIAAMANLRQFDLEDIVNRPGTYFNPQTEVLVVIDDSPDVDTEIFNLEDFEGADWVLISDESPIDENVRDELMQAFQVRHGAIGSGLDAGDDIVDEDENAPPEPDELNDE